MKTLVLGLGNELLGDEGVGVHAARLLQQRNPPSFVTVMPVGTAVLDALPALESVRRVILLDAVKAGGKPGALYRFDLTKADSPETVASMHGLSVFGVLALSGRKREIEGLVFGVEPERIEWSLTLSPSVSEALPKIVSLVESEWISPRERHFRQ